MALERSRWDAHSEVDEEELRRYLEAASRAPLLNREDQVRLAGAAKEGDERANKRLLEANLRLVVSIARRYESERWPLATLLDAGNIGLTRAVDSFDSSKGYKLSTYATWWIRQAIARRMAEGAES